MMRSSISGGRSNAAAIGAADSRVRWSGETRSDAMRRSRFMRSSAADCAMRCPSLERPKPDSLPYRMPSGLNTSPCRTRCTWLATTGPVYGGRCLEFTERGLPRPCAHPVERYGLTVGLTLVTARVLIKDLAASPDGTVTVAGWVETVRDQKKVQFVVLRDESGAVQLVNPRTVDADGVVVADEPAT